MELKKEKEVRSNPSKIEDKGNDGIRIETQQSYDELVKVEPTFCDEIITRLIRKCWQQKADARPQFFDICQLLSSQLDVVSKEGPELVIIHS